MNGSLGLRRVIVTGGGATVIGGAIDVRRAPATTDVLDGLADELGGLDVLVGNAGIF